MESSFRFFLVGSIALLLFDMQSFAQDPIDQYPGIPLVIYPARRTIEMIPQNFTQMSEMGIYGVVAPDAINISHSQYLQQYKDANLKVIPQQIWWAPNDIYKYTDAYYTVWEAEGTDPSKGLTTLYYDQTYTTYFDSAGIKGRRTINTTIPAGTQLIFGPGYPQVAEYKNTVFDTVINYTAEYRMKIVQKTTPPPGNDTLVVCTLKVTNTNEYGIETDIIPPVPIKVSDLSGWNNWKSIPIQYDLMNVTIPYIDEALAGQPTAFCVQFKIIWSGLPFLDLYIDNITISDQNGKAIATISDIQELVAEVAGNYITDSSIIGWYALDEPGSIDNYEPYRIVDHLIDTVSNGRIRLHTGFTGGKRGKFSSWLDIDTMALGKYQDQEFWLRAKPKNLQLNLYNYHYPYKPWSSYPSYNENWKELNIDYITNTYLDRINDLDTNFTFSTQTGGYYNYNTQCQFIDTFLVVPTKQQINYHVNLGLLYGARELRIDPMFSSYCGNSSNPKIVGLINLEEDTTANYNFFKNDLIPRLNGSFGKELKMIHQKVQHPNLQLPKTQPINSTYNWLTSITYLTGDGSSGADFIDVGFFETHFESGDVPYFMVVNRWYNTANQGDLLKISIDETGSGYTNWNVTNFIENTNQTIVNAGYITMPHIPGEARLFKVYPVLKDGGSLVVSETTHPNDVLFGDMSIENGVTLTVNGTYYAKANITVKSGGKIVAGQNAIINFGSGKKLIVEGIVEIKGTSENNNLTIVAGAEQAVLVKSGSAFTLNYCTILAPHTAIETETGIQSYVNISNTQITATRTGISLAGHRKTEHHQHLHL